MSEQDAVNVKQLGKASNLATDPGPRQRPCRLYPSDSSFNVDLMLTCRIKTAAANGLASMYLSMPTSTVANR